MIECVNPLRVSTTIRSIYTSVMLCTIDKLTIDYVLQITKQFLRWFAVTLLPLSPDLTARLIPERLLAYERRSRGFAAHAIILAFADYVIQSACMLVAHARPDALGTGLTKMV